VQARRLLRGDDLGAHRRERELVREEQLGEREPADRDERDRHPRAGRQDRPDQGGVQQPQQEDREQHAGLKPGVPAE
jgi:hypothetical protein